MKVDIYTREKNGSREIRFPLLPEEIEYDGGDAEFVTYDIMNRGEVAVPTGVGLAAVGWQSEFPGDGRRSDPAIRGIWKAPKHYHDILNDWKAKGTTLTLMVVGYPINVDVYVSKYSAVPYGATGDMRYTVEFLEARDITIKTTKAQSSNSQKRPAATSTTYTIKKGDTLWGISQKFLGAGSKWKTIYNANKSIIESTAKKHGRSSSDNGHWIYPGVKLTIPTS